VEINGRNRVILAGTNLTFTCHWLSTPAYWHFYSLTSGAAPCSFNSSQLHPGISLCPSVQRISLSHSSSRRYLWNNEVSLTVSGAQQCLMLELIFVEVAIHTTCQWHIPLLSV